ncbi:MAG: ATP-binding protein [Lachnospiraceae bacterium]
MSIRKYITIYLIFLILAISFIMSLFVNVLADRVIHYDIQGTLVREMMKNNKNIQFVDGKFQPNESFEYEDDGKYFQVLSENGKLLLGENPDGVEVPEIVENQRLSIWTYEGKEYYIIERVNRKLTKETGYIIYNRCIVGKKNIDSKYQFIKIIAYSTIPVFLLFVLCAGLMMSKKISEPLIQMSKTAETIGKDGELSKRMEYDGKITELAILSDTNNHMLERVENMFETQKRFSSDVAHELRTPIAVLLAQCEYAKEYSGTKEEFDESIDVIYRQAQKTNEIVTQLLNLNRLERGAIVLDLEEVSLDEIICSICDDVEIKEKENVKFQLTLPGIRANLDVGLMFILLQNLIQNAVKYSTKPAVVEITTGREKESVFVKIKDYGCGIKEEEQKKIFTPFYRADKSRNSEGFGLGLSLAHRIAQMHGGRIDVESVWGEGSTFTVVLPKR